MEMENIYYVNYSGRVEVSLDALIDIDKIDVSLLIKGLNSLGQKKEDKRYVVNNISKAIHDALAEE